MIDLRLGFNSLDGKNPKRLPEISFLRPEMAEGPGDCYNQAILYPAGEAVFNSGGKT